MGNEYAWKRAVLIEGDRRIEKSILVYNFANRDVTFVNKTTKCPVLTHL